MSVLGQENIVPGVFGDARSFGEAQGLSDRKNSIAFRGDELARAFFTSEVCGSVSREQFVAGYNGGYGWTRPAPTKDS
jgi:hypothetical protein